jgi:acetyl esterase/lipase
MLQKNPFDPAWGPEPRAPLTFIPGLAYGEADGVLLRLDILSPSLVPATPLPVVIYLHGGGWDWGNRGEGMQPLLQPFLAAHGFFTVSLTYRLSWQAPFPAALHDVKAGVRWVRAHAQQYHLDPERIGVWGASAGGHLAALLGVTGDQPELEGAGGSPGYSSGVQAVVVAFGPSDLLLPGGHLEGSPEVTRLFGGTLRDREALMRQASPMTYVSHAAPPFYLIHGTQDDIVPFAHAERLHRALRAAGVEVTLHPLQGVGHDWGLEWAQIAPEYLAFFQKHLRP